MLTFFRTTIALLLCLSFPALRSARAGEGTMGVTLAMVEQASTEKELRALLPKLDAYKGRDRDLLLGIAYHQLAALQTTDDNVGLALKYTAAAWKQLGSAIALGYQGSALTLEASRLNKKGNVVGASAKLEEGAKLIDQAVAKEPDNLSLRFLRLANAIEVSEKSPVPRYDIARVDAQYLEAHAAGFSALNSAFLHLLAGRLAMKSRQIDRALAHFEKAVQSAPGSAYAAQAKKYLAQLEE